jgi:hypothetical protein
MELGQLKVALSVVASLLVASLSMTAWSSYKMNTFQDTLSRQLRGELSATAQALTRAQNELGTIKSEMVNQREMVKRSAEIISTLDQKTQESIDRFQRETGAKVDSISVRFTRMETRLERGIKKIGDQKKPVAPPPSDWKGVSKEDQRRCSSYPDKCEPFKFSWESPFKVKGDPLALFSTPNIWGEEFTLDLNLAFKVVVIGYGEDQSRLGSGAAQNQGIHIYAGYLDEQSGKFVAIAEQELLEGDPLLDPKMFYRPKVDPDKVVRGLDLIEPSLLVGVSYQQNQTGLSVGASLLNFKKGEYRVGSNVSLTSEDSYLGAFLSYHPQLLEKSLNIAPSVGYMWNKDLNPTWSLALHFQVW